MTLTRGMIAWNRCRVGWDEVTAYTTRLRPVANHDMGDCRRGSGDIAAVAGLQERSVQAGEAGAHHACLRWLRPAGHVAAFRKIHGIRRIAGLARHHGCGRVLRAVGTAGDDHRARPARPAPDGRGAHPIRAGLHRAPYRLDLRGVSDHRLADRLFVISSAQHVAHAEGDPDRR